MARVDVETVKSILVRSDIAFILVAPIVGCARWWVLIGHLGIFFNNFLPTGVGSDVARAMHLNSREHNAKSFISSALADRIIGLVVMLVMGAFSILISTELRTDRPWL